MPHGHSAIDSLIALTALRKYQAGGPIEEDTILDILSRGKYQTSEQIPPLSTTGKITPENLSSLWSALNPPLPEGVQAPGLGQLEWAVAPPIGKAGKAARAAEALSKLRSSQKKQKLIRQAEDALHGVPKRRLLQEVENTGLIDAYGEPMSYFKKMNVDDLKELIKDYYGSELVSSGAYSSLRKGLKPRKRKELGEFFEDEMERQSRDWPDIPLSYRTGDDRLAVKFLEEHGYSLYPGFGSRAETYDYVQGGIRAFVPYGGDKVGISQKTFKNPTLKELRDWMGY